jgi:hypothetical protein
MISSVVVVVLFAAQNASDPAARAVVSTAEQALAPGAFVVFREGSDAPTDDDALLLEKSLRSDATATITWADADHLTARIRVHDRERSRWLDRSLVFRAADAPAERARAIGFALATMVQGAPSESPDRLPTNVPWNSTPAPSAPLLRRELGMLGVMGIGIAGRAAGIGATLDGRWRAGALWLRVGGSMRWGSAPEADASSRAVKLDAGVVWLPLQIGNTFMGPRLDVGAVQHRLARPIEGGTESTAGRWIPVATLQLELRWPVTSEFVVGAAAGIEAAVGTTRVLLDGQQVATIPPLRTVAEIGLGLRF